MQTPSISALRALEAAARHESYSAAARELALTHGAVSHQIRDLEARLGCVLFERSGSRMVPTPAAQHLLVNIRHALRLLEDAFADHRRRPRVHISLSTTPAIALHWLIPRLERFIDLHRDIALEIDATSRLVPLAEGSADVVLRYGAGGWRGVASEHLADEHVFPVCTPEYLAANALDTPQDLHRCRLLESRWQPWAPWLHAAGMPSAPAVSVHFNDTVQLLGACLAGVGVALGRSRIVDGLLRSRRLVCPFGPQIPEPHAYHLAWRTNDTANRNAVDALRSWLKREFAAQAADADPGSPLRVDQRPPATSTMAPVV